MHLGILEMQCIYKSIFNKEECVVFLYKLIRPNYFNILSPQTTLIYTITNLELDLFGKWGVLNCPL